MKLDESTRWPGWQAIVSGLLLAGASMAASAATVELVEGERAPDFVGYDSEGKRLSVADYAGKVVVLSFWASWCGPCRKELPMLEGIAITAKERVQVLAVNIESRDVYRKIVPKMASLAMLVASDATHEAQKSYGVSGIPHMVIIGKDGRVLRVHQGYSDAGVDDAVDDLNQALAKK